jgi:hypothetical protein
MLSLIRKEKRDLNEEFYQLKRQEEEKKFEN